MSVFPSVGGSCPGKPANASGIIDGNGGISPVVGTNFNSGNAGSSFRSAQNLTPTAATATSWQQIPFVSRSAPSPPSRDGAASAYDEAHGVIVVFGGRHYELISGTWTFSQLDDTWTWDGKTWTEQHPAVHPPGRTFTGMAYDPAIGKTILFGGLSCGDAGFCNDWLNDTWAWDGNNWSQLTPATSPPARNSPSLAFDFARQKLVLFGGIPYCCPAQFLGDTWTFDGTNWTQETPLTSPSARFADNSLMTFVPANNGLLLWGGRDSTGSTNDTWLWDGSNWNQLTPAISPPASFDPAIVYDPATSKAVLYRYESETWTWDGQNWTKSAALSPPSRYGSVYVYDPAAGKVAMAFGSSCLPMFEDLWLWDGTSWTQVDLGDRFPPQRTYSQMAFDTTRNQAVLFSGVREGCSFLFDTWTWNGAVWKWIHSASDPTPRAWATLAYDPDHAVTVLFGGRGSDARDLNDTWLFDGTNWSKRSPAQRPAAREAAAMAFDSVSHKIVLFGGYNGSELGDTWSWDGNNWTQEQPTTSPPMRLYSKMAHDAQGAPVLFGGATGSLVTPTALGDTWRWNGAGASHTWEPLAPGPPPRYATGMGFDARSQNIILYGGLVNGFVPEFLGDTWAFDGTTWQPLSPTTSPSGRGFPATCDGSITNPPALMGGSSNAFLGDAWTWGIPTPQVQLNGVVSRKIHGSAGTFDIDLPLTGSPGIECRSGGATNDYTIVLTFANTLTGVANASVSSGTGMVSSGAIDSNDAHQYIVNLTGVTNAQVITVSLSNVNDSAGDFSSDVSTTMGVLFGDTTANGSVNSSDISQTKAQSGTVATSSNFRTDVTVNGLINSSDISTVKSKSGTSLP